MPLVKMYLRAGKNEEFLRAVSESVHSALVSTANVPADDRFHVFTDLKIPTEEWNEPTTC
jgi:hypothetical protein